MKSIVKRDEADVSEPECGLTRHVLASSKDMSLVRHEMQAGWKGSRHSHPHEQLVYVVSGRVRLIRGSEVFDLDAGDSVIVPANVEHEAASLEASEVLDVFTPARLEYLSKGPNA